MKKKISSTIIIAADESCELDPDYVKTINLKSHGYKFRLSNKFYMYVSACV